MRQPAAVQTHALTKCFGSRTALDRLDLRVEPGTVFGYLGPNGAGKTTTIKLLAGLLRPTSGWAVVLGHDVAKDRDLAQSRIGYLPGDFSGYSDHTGERFLRLIGALRGGVDWAYVQLLAERFSIDLSRRIGTLSHGNRQKIGIIQACMNRPDLLLLDEPTNGLDPLMQREFLALLREIRDTGRSVLLSSHILTEVAAVADSVGILNEGRLIAVRSLRELEAESVRSIDLTFDDQVPLGLIHRTPGVRAVTVAGLTAHVVVAGSTADLIRGVAPYGVVDVRTQETDLSDLFLSYYGVKGGSDAKHLPEGDVGPAQDTSRMG